jgi:hypothetical protein
MATVFFSETLVSVQVYMAQALSCWPLTVEARVRARVDKVALGQIFLKVFLFSPVNIIPPWLSTLIYNLGMNNTSVGGRSSETYSHAIEMNNSFIFL